MKKYFVMLILVLLLLCLAACGAATTENNQEQGEEPGQTEEQTASKGTLRWGTNANYHAYADAMAPELEALGYDVEVVAFDDAMTVDIATFEGSIDFNLYQHKPYLDNFNAANDGDLVMVEPLLFAGVMGLASYKYTDAADIPDGALIAIAQDASNKDRGLRLLRDNGLLTLIEADDNYSYTLLDITENPHNYEFVEVELSSMIKSLEDVDAACFSVSYLYTSGVGTDCVLLYSKDDYRFPLGVVVKEENVDAPWLEDVMAVCTSDKSIEVVRELWGDAYNILFEE